MSAAIRDGGCLCGAVRYRIGAAPNSVGYCHCSLCRRASGAPVVAWASVPSESFTFITGTPVAYRSSAVAERQFCGKCGTQITFRYLRTPREIDVTLASLDDPEALEPAYHIWTANRLAWFDTADTLPRHREHGPDTLPALPSSA
jgi:hypothetical protein